MPLLCPRSYLFAPGDRPDRFAEARAAASARLTPARPEDAFGTHERYPRSERSNDGYRPL